MKPQTRGGPDPVRRLAALAALAVLLPGCRLLSTPSLSTVPPGWRRPAPWGPEANDLRAEGKLPYHQLPPATCCWAEFARQNLQDGDIVLRKAESCLLPVFDLSTMLARICDSPFSHSAIARWEGDTLWLYDVEAEGVRRMPFALWMLDVKECLFAILRAREPYRCAIPQALCYCEDAYRRKVKFDYRFKPGDERLYCTELVEHAYRSAGVPLTDPVPIRCLPNYRDYRCLFVLAASVSHLHLGDAVYCTGNASYGLLASPCLELVYLSPTAEGPERTGHKPPRCVAPAAEGCPVGRIGNPSYECAAGDP